MDKKTFDNNGLERLISVVIPAFNEAESLTALFEEIAAALAGQNYEVIFIDDGSVDETPSVIERLADEHGQVRGIEFRRNFGKAAALDAGFRAARGDVVITMDADLQDDPAEIPRFLQQLDSGFDVVSGWKQVRNDPADKTLPSKVFNSVVSRLGGIRLNDFNCGYKAYRSEALKNLSLYGELHRFIPVLLHWRGFRIGEMAVNHRARQFGKSKYGMSRMLKGAFDLLTVILNTRFQSRPLHIFGAAGAVMGAIGLAILSYLTVLWFTSDAPIGNRPALFLGILLVLSSFQFFTVGLLGEFIRRQATDEGAHYYVRRVLNEPERSRVRG